MSSAPGDTGAVILAAGLSSRMGTFKPLLPCGRNTLMVERSIQLFQTCGVSEVIVVTGHNHDRLEEVARSAGARCVRNPAYKSGMLSSVHAGFGRIRQHTGGVFLLPVDIPAVRALTIDALISASGEHPGHVILPVFDGIPGHPPLIPAELKEDILSLKPDQTLRDLLWSPSIRRYRVPVMDRGVLIDADDPAGYNAVCQKIKNQHVPDKEECLAIIDQVWSSHASVRGHLACVAMTALKLSHAACADLDADLVVAAALLHDISRGQERHAEAGAEYIRSLGFGKVADIIARHMDLTIEPGQGLDETQVVYFADKICNKDRVDLDYHSRFFERLKKYPWAMTSITRRYETTRYIHRRIEEAAGKSLEALLA